MARKSAQCGPRTTRSSRTRANSRSQRNGSTIHRRLSQTLAETLKDAASTTAAASSVTSIKHNEQVVNDSRPQPQPQRMVATAFDDQKDIATAHLPDSTSQLSSSSSSSRSSPNAKAAQPQVKAAGSPKVPKQQPKAVATRYESPLPIQQEKFEKEQRKRDRKTVRNVASAKRAAKDKAQRAAEKTEKRRELVQLAQQDRLAPAPWSLQLTNLPPRLNITGRALPLKVPFHDDTLPSTESAREAYVADVLDAMRDVRQAEDTVSLTTDFWYVWLKPSLEGKFSYAEVDMERICRKLVSIAEGLHNHGLGATEIFCPPTIQRAQDSKEMSFKDRIDKLALLMRKSKARCNALMLNNTLEDTVALIDHKLADHESNAANNKNRSLKLGHSNNVLGMQTASKWPKDDNGRHMLATWSTPATDHVAPVNLNTGITENDHIQGFRAQHAEDLQSHIQLLPWLAGPEQLPPSAPQWPAQTYSLPWQPSYIDFDGLQGPTTQPAIRPTSDFYPAEFDPAMANHDFNLTYTHHGVPLLSGPDDNHISQVFDFSAEEQRVEPARQKRPCS